MFACDLCGFLYNSEKLAKQCQDWCTKHKSCNLEITGKSIGRKSDFVPLE